MFFDASTYTIIHMQSLDHAVNLFFTSIRSAGGVEFMYLVSRMFDSVPFIIICIAVAALIYLVRSKRWTISFAFTILLSAVLVWILKIVFAVSRPTDAVLVLSDKSFPSGHTTMATVFFTVLMYDFDDYLSRGNRIAFNLICVGGIVLVALSRLYLGVHWLSDVLGGLAFGFLFSAISVYIFRKFIRHRV